MQQPADPFGHGYRTVPVPGSGAPAITRGTSLWQFALAAVVLYMVMRYVPHGVEIGVIILFGAFLSTPAAVRSFTGLLTFLQTGV